MKAIAYLKQQCGWSRGVREVLEKYDVDYEEKQIHIVENYQEMIEKTGQPMQPCVQLSEEVMLVDISGLELESYLAEHGHTSYKEGNSDIPLDRPCTEEEELAKAKAATASTPKIPIKDTGFYGAGRG